MLETIGVSLDPARNVVERADAVDHRRIAGADAGDGVDVGNLKGQKGIRRVLDEFGRVDVRNDQQLMYLQHIDMQVLNLQKLQVNLAYKLLVKYRYCKNQPNAVK